MTILEKLPDEFEVACPTCGNDELVKRIDLAPDELVCCKKCGTPVVLKEG